MTMDAALIKECADPSLKHGIVEQFVSAVGPGDPLAITVKSGGRLILVPKPKTPDEAMAVVRQYVGQAVVRVGMTQLPVGVGVKDASQMKDDLVDACGNFKRGTTMFAKILRIVAKWYGNPKGTDVFPQIFDDAVYAWKTGEFEGQDVFQAEDPGGVITDQRVSDEASEDPSPEAALTPQDEGVPEPQENTADDSEIRVDLSRINGK